MEIDMKNYAKAELHLHLDGSLNIRWAYEKSLQRDVIDKDMSFEEFYNLLYAKNIAHSPESFKKFEIVCNVLQHREDLFEATYNLVRDLSEKGIIYAEIRFASQQHTRYLSQLEALQAVVDGAAKAMDDHKSIKVGIINALMHKGDSAAFNHEANLETIYATKALLGKGAVGLDLAGFENNCDFKEYAYLFKMTEDMGIPYTIHAGEMGIAEHVADALDMHPRRIGHGIDCVKDEKVLQRVLDSHIPLEICVSSNCKLERNYAAHPIRFLIEKGANVTINTDNMIFARSDLLHEYDILSMIGVSEDQLRQCTINAIDAGFMDDDTRSRMLEEIARI